MITIDINGQKFKGAEDWSEITIEQACRIVQLFDEEAPEKLKRLYKLEDIEPTDEDVIKHFPAFYIKVLKLWFGIPDDIANQITWSSATAFYKEHLERFVVSCIYQPMERFDDITSFEFDGETYYLPESLDKFGNYKPMAGEEAVTFIESADLELAARKIMAGRFDYAANVIAIICRPKGEKYDEGRAIERAKAFRKLPMSIYWRVFFWLMKLKEKLQEHILTSSMAEVSKLRSARKSQGSVNGDGMAALSELQKQESSIETT